MILDDLPGAVLTDDAIEPRPYPAEQERVTVQFGTETMHFVAGHELTVADILDALDGETARVFTTATHDLMRTDGVGITTFHSDPTEVIVFDAGDEFEAIRRAAIN